MQAVDQPATAPRSPAREPSIGDIIASKMRTRLMRDLAKAAGISMPTMSKLRHDLLTRVQPRTRAGLLRALRITAAELDAAMDESARRYSAARAAVRVHMDTI